VQVTVEGDSKGAGVVEAITAREISEEVLLLDVEEDSLPRESLVLSADPSREATKVGVAAEEPSLRKIGTAIVSLRAARLTQENATTSMAEAGVADNRRVMMHSTLASTQSPTKK